MLSKQVDKTITAEDEEQGKNRSSIRRFVFWGCNKGHLPETSGSLITISEVSRKNERSAVR